MVSTIGRVHYGPLSTHGLELCCIGFNHESSTLSAIVKIMNPTGWGALCSPGSTARVGFWIQTPNKLFFVGESTVRIFDFVGSTRHYAVHLVMLPELIGYINQCSADNQFFKMHCLLTVSDIPINSSNFNGAAIKSQFVVKNNVDIQFPKKSHWGLWQVHERHGFESQAFPVHGALLPNGKVLLFSGAVGDWTSVGRPIGKDEPYARKYDQVPEHLHETCSIYDAATHVLVEIQPPIAETDFFHDLFCTGHSVLPDGRVLAVGGTRHWGNPSKLHQHAQNFEGLTNTSIFNPFTATWEKGPDMKNARWYPSTVVLGNGDVFIMGGHPGPGDKFDGIRHSNTDMEIYETKKNSFYYPQVNGAFKMNPSSEFTSNNILVTGAYERLHLLPDGSIFCASHIMNEDKETHELRWTNMKWDPVSEDWHEVFVQSGEEFHGWGFGSVLLPFKLDTNGNYSAADIMVFNEKNTYRCRPLENQNWALTSPRLLNTQRKNLQSLLLPNGKVFFGGGIYEVFIPPDDQTGEPGRTEEHEVFGVEIYDPSNNTWEIADSLTIARGYHSTGLLLKDATILLAGADLYGGQEGVARWGDRQLSLEIWTPDYLWRNPRPEFSISATSYFYGDTIELTLENSWNTDLIGDCVLIRLYAVTHSLTFDQRMVELKKVSVSSKQKIKLQIPSNSNLVPPGFYYLFVNSAEGCPSIAEIIQIS